MSAPGRVRVAPSLLASDFSRLDREVRRLEEAGCDLLHLDVMDGRFVPNLTFGPVVVAAVKRVARRPLDVHLMIEEPIRFVDAFAAAGAATLTVHVEACRDAAATLAEIRSAGMRPGLTLRPGTPFESIEPFLEAAGLVLVMTVEPGFGGQAYRTDQEGKLRRAREVRASRGLDFELEVDGGIGPGTAESAVRAGAEILVAGTALFTAPDPAELIREWHALSSP